MADREAVVTVRLETDEAKRKAKDLDTDEKRKADRRDRADDKRSRKRDEKRAQESGTETSESRARRTGGARGLGVRGAAAAAVAAPRRFRGALQALGVIGAVEALEFLGPAVAGFVDEAVIEGPTKVISEGIVTAAEGASDWIREKRAALSAGVRTASQLRQMAAAQALTGNPPDLPGLRAAARNLYFVNEANANLERALTQKTNTIVGRAFGHELDGWLAKSFGMKGAQ